KEEQSEITVQSCSIIQPQESKAVLLDATILGVVAAKKYHGLREAMKVLNATGLRTHYTYVLSQLGRPIILIPIKQDGWVVAPTLFVMTTDEETEYNEFDEEV
nr:FGGY carbohydrate kinase domain-containing protein isoform X2 [Tanacetum cinerariifolium]